MRLITKYLIAIISCVAISFGTQAKKENFFLDEKSQVIGIATVGSYNDGDLYEKFVKSPIDGRLKMPLAPKDTIFPSESEMTSYLKSVNAGRIVIDDLLRFDGQKFDESELRRRAELNNIRSDHERASIDILGAQNVLRDDVNPIITNNYLFVRLLYRKPYYDKNGEQKERVGIRDYIYKVVVDQNIIESIYEAWDDPVAYKKIQIPLQYIETPKSDDKTLGSITSALESTNTDFKNFGQLVKRSSFDLGDRAGVKRGDNVTIYRQMQDRNGNFYSKRIARGKVNGFDEGGKYAHFFRVSGNAGNYKNGDLATVSHSSNFNFGGQVEFGEKTWSAGIVGDYAFGFTKSGLYSHMLLKLGYCQTMHPGRRFEYNYGTYKSPSFIDFGLGYGIGKTLIGFFDIMPYVMAEYEMAEMRDANATYSADKEDDVKKLKGHFIRVPIGVRLNINIAYPCRLMLEVGYAFQYGFDEIKETGEIKEAMKEIGAKRDGYFVSVGLLF